MNVKIKLTRKGPFLWFLGDPRTAPISLTQENPGPIEVDFEGLTEPEQKKILHSLRTGKIATDAEFEDLQSRWAKCYPAVPQEEILRKQEEELWLQEQKRLHQKRELLLKEQEQRQEELRKRSYAVLNGSARAVQSALKDVTDVELLNMIIQIEQDGKNRKSVLKQLNTKKRHIALKREVKIAKQVERQTRKQIKALEQQETINPDVIESEVKTMVLSHLDSFLK